jgi:hypothetical protein
LLSDTHTLYDLTSLLLLLLLLCYNHVITVTRPGFRLASLNPGQAINGSTQTGVVCGANKYSVGGTRLSSCTACPSGMVTVGDLASNHNSVNDCRECTRKGLFTVLSW